MDEIKRGNLYIADLDPVKGSEQGGAQTRSDCSE